LALTLSGAFLWCDKNSPREPFSVSISVVSSLLALVWKCPLWLSRPGCYKVCYTKPSGSQIHFY